MKYYYNKQENAFAIYITFVPKETLKGYNEITRAKYEELQEELKKASEETERTE